MAFFLRDARWRTAATTRSLSGSARGSVSQTSSASGCEPDGGGDTTRGGGGSTRPRRALSLSGSARKASPPPDDGVRARLDCASEGAAGRHATRVRQRGRSRLLLLPLASARNTIRLDSARRLSRHGQAGKRASGQAGKRACPACVRSIRSWLRRTSAWQQTTVTLSSFKEQSVCATSLPLDADLGMAAARYHQAFVRV